MKEYFINAIAQRKWLQVLLGSAFLVAAFELFQVFVSVFGIKFPAGLIGMIALFAMLYCGVFPVRYIDAACKFALSHMAICFAPILVMIVANRHILDGKLIQIFGAAAISSALTMICTSITVECLQRRRNKKGGSNGSGEQ